MVDGGIPFPMISDAAGNLGKVYGVYDENAGVDIRGRFIIDPDGVVQAMEVLTPPVGRHLEETIRHTDCDTVVIGTPINLARLIDIGHASTRVQYSFKEQGLNKLEHLLESFIHKHEIKSEQWDTSN